MNVSRHLRAGRVKICSDCIIACLHRFGFWELGVIVGWRKGKKAVQRLASVDQSLMIYAIYLGSSAQPHRARLDEPWHYLPAKGRRDLGGSSQPWKLLAKNAPTAV